LSIYRMIFNFELLSRNYVVCRTEPNSAIPDRAHGKLVSLTRTANEISIVYPGRNVPDDV
jgi:hypothetical protein